MPKPVLGVLLVLLSGVSAFSQQPAPGAAGQAAAAPSPAGTLRQIMPGHYVYSVTTFNSGIIATSEGAVVLDALSSEAVARAQRDAIASTIRQPVRMLVSSTFHNQYLSELFFDNQFLFINDGYGLDWLRGLDTVASLDADIFVPGHGPIPADPRDTRQRLARFRQLLVDVRDSVQKEIARGVTEDQAVAAIRWPQYEKLQGYDAQRETAIRRLYRQLSGTLQ